MPRANKTATTAQPAKGGNGKPNATTPATPTPTKPVGGSKKKAPLPPVVHEKIKTVICTPEHAGPLTAVKAQAILGWEEETEGVTFGDAECDPVIKQLYGKKVRMRWNTVNRYLTGSWLMTLKQEHLHRRWRFNGETIVVGNRNRLLSGQNRLISLILAEYERKALAERLKEHSPYHTLWPTEVTMDTLVVYGIPEDDETFKTLNCGKPGTFAEFMYRSEFLAGDPPADRKALARMLDYAIKLVWDRTWAQENPYDPKHDLRKTNGEAHDFLLRHKHLVDAVREVYREDVEIQGLTGAGSKKAISRLISPGAAAGMLYLMATSASDGKAYHEAEPKREMKSERVPLLNFSRWDKAREFLIQLGKKDGDGESPFSEVRDAIRALRDPNTLKGDTLEAKTVVLAKAWNVFLEGREPLYKEVYPHYAVDGDTQERTLDDPAEFGGIDKGPQVDEPAAADGGLVDDEADETLADVIENETDPKVIERRAALAKQAELARKRKEQGGAEVHAPGEVERPAPTQYDKDGKPPAPKLKVKEPTGPLADTIKEAQEVQARRKLKPLTRKEIEAEQTRQAAEADAALAAQTEPEEGASGEATEFVG